MAVPVSRKIRLVCVSDTHNASPLTGAFKLPKGDVLIHAGDLSNQGSLSELRKTVDWIENADFKAKIVIAGNHDITLDEAFYAEHGSSFHKQHPQDPAECLSLFKDASTITYLNHEAATIHLPAPAGYQCTFKVFASPYSPAKGLWAFSYQSDRPSGLWDQIPLDTDILITHTPPQFHCDSARGKDPAGCESLRQALWRVRPRLAICGHIHEGRGAEIVKWDLEIEDGVYKEEKVVSWEDPGKETKKQSLLDLTTRSGMALHNDGSTGEVEWPMNNGAVQIPSIATNGEHPAPSLPSSSLETPDTCVRDHQPPSNPRNTETLLGPVGRRETCIINAAIMASSWPHKGSGGKKYNKPIVVDIDLPCLPCLPLRAE
ncbi:MAG: hypothetical protein M1835_005120 [Candelina submexicana]|nr:MAG: hypothetical protein M1835_005120 [Candelina submexicana]